PARSCPDRASARACRLAMTALCGTMPDAVVERPLYDEAERRWQIGYGAPTNLCSRAGLALLAETVRARVLRRLPSGFRCSIRGGAARKGPIGRGHPAAVLGRCLSVSD